MLPSAMGINEDQLRRIGMDRNSETHHACANVGAVFDLEICSRT